MTEIIIVHITDIHIRNSLDEINKRAACVGSALAKHFDTGRPVVLALGGDIAWSAKPAEYDLADKFIAALSDSLTTAGFENLGLTIAPGNHDCDFDLQDEHERHALCAAAKDLEKSPSLYRALSVVQKPFRDFLYLAGLDTVDLAPTLQRLQVEVNGRTLCVDTLNTSWGAIKDKSEGHLPFAQIDVPRSDATVVNILVAHHPPNWFMQEHKAALQRWIDETYDIVLYGHEHYNDELERRARHSGAAITIVAGSAFSSRERATDDGFSVLSIGTEGESCLRQATFRWTGDKFVLLGELSSGSFSLNPAKRRPRRSFKKEFQQELDDPGVQLKHPDIIRQIRLSEIYIEPRLSIFLSNSGQDSDPAKALPALNLLNKGVAGSPNVDLSLVFGPEQCGKSVLCKQLCLSAQADGRVPLWLDVSVLSSSNAGEITAWINKTIVAAYVGECEVFYQSSRDERVILLDGLERLRGKPAAKIALLERCIELAGKVIATISASSATEGLLVLGRGEKKLPEAEIREFVPLSRQLTMQLIKRWHMLGRIDPTSDDDLDSKCRQVAAHMSVMLGRHGLPPYPLSVLLLLQLTEALKDSTAIVADGSLGYIMDSLIVADLQRNPICTNVGIVMGYLGEFAWYLEQKNAISVDEVSFNEFHKNFLSTHGLTLDESRIRKDLSTARFMTVAVGVIRFRYPYLFHFFLARHLSTIYDTKNGSNLVDQLIRYVHTDKAASVLTFLAHFIDSSDLVVRLVQRARDLQSSSIPVDFWKGSSFFARFQSKKDREALLAYDSEQAETDVADDELDHQEVGEGDVTQIEMFPAEEDVLGWASSLKLIHILGQVLRSRSTRMDVVQKTQVIESCLGLARRTLGFAFSELERDAPALVHASSKAFEKLLDVNREKAMRHANSFLGWLVVAFSCTYVFRFGRACGAEEFEMLNSRLLASAKDENDKLFFLAARILGEKVLVEDELLKMFEQASKNADLLPVAIIRRLARYRLHVSPPDDVQRRRVGRKLGLEQTLLAITAQGRGTQVEFDQ